MVHIVTMWGTDKDEYIEHVFISADQTVSFVVYWYKQKPDNISIRNLYVAPKARGKGVGSSVMNNLMEWCKANKKTLNLWARKNESIVKWYSSLGFVYNGEYDKKNVWMVYN